MELGQNSNGSSVSASQSQTSANDVKKKKVLIEVHPNGKPVGELSAKFITRAGELVRAHCPVSYKDWRVVSQNFKDDVWNALMKRKEFSSEVVPMAGPGSVQKTCVKWQAVLSCEQFWILKQKGIESRTFVRVDIFTIFPEVYL